MPMGQKEVTETILQAIAQLSATQRHVLQPVNVEGYTYCPHRHDHRPSGKLFRMPPKDDYVV